MTRAMLLSLSVAVAAPPNIGLPLPGVPPSEPAGAAQPVEPAVPTPPVVDAEALYQQGEEAYWLGDFALAVEKFEAAYAASRLPGLLYNVGLAYLRRFELTRDPADLQRARAVLRNYSIELEKDPSLGQAENVPKLLTQIDALLAEQKPAAPEPTATPTGPATCPEPPPPSPSPSPADGRARRAGAALMGTGSLLLVGGVTSALVLAFKGRAFGAELADIRAEQATAGCADMSSATCDYLDDAARVTTANGRQANLLAAGLGGGLTALGVAGLVVGGVLYGRSGAPRGTNARLHINPAPGGLVLSGRF